MIKEFSIGASHTINLGNYESSRFEATITIDVPNGASDDDRQFALIKEGAQNMLSTLLKETYQAQLRKRVERNGKAKE